ncbi:MAG TPA: hypothetical protein VFB01_11705 [Burkholderiales bacterium]|nr:hypothetical protein [Burkholderiales bacterium]
MSPPAESEGSRSAVAAIGRQGQEAQKGLREIIGIWKKFREDREPSIRILTLMATVVGFFALLVLIVLVIECLAKVPFGQPVQVEGYKWCLMGSLGLFFANSLPVVIKLTARAPALELAEGFENIYRQKHGSSSPSKNAEQQQ